MADSNFKARKRLRYIRRSYAQVSGPFKFLWHWANNKQKLWRFRSLQKWATQRRKHAKTPRAIAKWGNKRHQYRARVQELERPPVGVGAPGPPHWAGAASIVEQEVVPVFNRHGAPISSRKRFSTLGNPDSDHYVGNTTAYAVDAATFSGADDAHAVAKALGIPDYRTGDYTGYYIHRSGNTFRVQILWGVSGHWNHVHVGVKRV
jgi:hypothetical protein